jgi:hypothetical protein
MWCDARQRVEKNEGGKVKEDSCNGDVTCGRMRAGRRLFREAARPLGDRGRHRVWSVGPERILVDDKLVNMTME